MENASPVAARIFELDDNDGPVRERLLQMEKSWRALLAQNITRAIELGHLRALHDDFND